MIVYSNLTDNHLILLNITSIMYKWSNERNK